MVFSVEPQFLFLFVSFFVIEGSFFVLRMPAIINCLVAYWYAWLLISLTGPLGLFVPSLNIICYHIIFLASFSVGAIIYLFGKRQNIHYPFRNTISVETNRLFLQRSCGLFFRLFVLLLPSTVYYFSKGARLILSGSTEGLRGLVINMIDNPIFSSTIVNFFYYVVFNGLWTCYMLLACIYLVEYNKKRHILMVAFYAVLMSGIYFSRTYFYYFFVTLIWSILLSFWSVEFRFSKCFITIARKIFFSKIFRAASFVLFSLVVLISLQSDLRSQSSSHGGLTFGETLIKYHTVGFTLFDIEDRDWDSPLNSKPTYGLGVVGGLEYYVALIIRQIDREYKPLVARASLGDFKIVGTGPDDKEIRGNACYNLVYTLVRDGKYIALILVGGCLGYITNRYLFLWGLRKSVFGYLISLFLFSLLTTSIFRSNLESPSYWLCIFFLMCFSVVYRNCHLRVRKVFIGSAHTVLKTTKNVA